MMSNESDPQFRMVMQMLCIKSMEDMTKHGLKWRVSSDDDNHTCEVFSVDESGNETVLASVCKDTPEQAIVDACLEAMYQVKFDERT